MELIHQSRSEFDVQRGHVISLKEELDSMKAVGKKMKTGLRRSNGVEAVGRKINGKTPKAGVAVGSGSSRGSQSSRSEGRSCIEAEHSRWGGVNPPGV